MKAPNCEPFDHRYRTSFNMEIRVTASEFMFYKVLNDLFYAGELNIPSCLGAELLMLTKGYDLVF